jgi:TonB family protein
VTLQKVVPRLGTVRKPSPHLCAIALFFLAGCATDNVVFKDESASSVSAPGGHSRAVLTKVAPSYPGYLRKAGITGTVIVRLWIDRNGAVAGADVLSSPHPELSALALAAIRQWVFAPDPTAPEKYLVMALPISFDVTKP